MVRQYMHAYVMWHPEKRTVIRYPVAFSDSQQFRIVEAHP